MDFRKSGERRPLLNFYLRRFFRIAPLFYVAILLNLLWEWRVARLGMHGAELGWLDILLGFTFLHGLKPEAINSVAIGGWSIAVEMMFYAVFPFIYFRVRNIVHAFLLCASSALVCNLISWSLAAHTADLRMKEFFTFLWFPIELPVFCLGILIYRIWRDLPNKTILPGRVGSVVFEDLRTQSMLLLIISVLGFWGILPISNHSMLASSLFLALFAYSLVVFEWPFLVNRLTMHLGRVSYSIYLLHFFVINLFDRLIFHFEASFPFRVHGSIWALLAVFVAILGVSTGVATLSQRFVEAPGVALGRRMISCMERLPVLPLPRFLGNVKH